MQNREAMMVDSTIHMNAARGVMDEAVCSPGATAMP
jgi:hypothetical protein